MVDTVTRWLYPPRVIQTPGRNGCCLYWLTGQKQIPKPRASEWKHLQVTSLCDKLETAGSLQWSKGGRTASRGSCRRQWSQEKLANTLAWQGPLSASKRAEPGHQHWRRVRWCWRGGGAHGGKGMRKGQSCWQGRWMVSRRKLSPHWGGFTSPAFSLLLFSLILVHRTRVSLPTRELSSGKSSTLYTVSSRGSEATCFSSASSAFFTPAIRAENETEKTPRRGAASASFFCVVCSGAGWVHHRPALQAEPPSHSSGVVVTENGLGLPCSNSPSPAWEGLPALWAQKVFCGLETVQWILLFSCLLIACRLCYQEGRYFFTLWGSWHKWGKEWMNKQQFYIYEVPALPTERLFFIRTSHCISRVSGMSKNQTIYLAEPHHHRASSIPIPLLPTLINPLQTKLHSIQFTLLPSARLRVALILPKQYHCQAGIPSGFSRPRPLP